MAGVWTASLVFGLFVCVARSQQIYHNENNDCVRNEQTMLILKDQINFLKQENAREINSLRQENAREINSLRQENARKIDSLTKENARKIDFLTMENARIKEYFDEMLSILKKNISDSEEDLKSSILKIITNGLNLKKDCNDLYINGNTKSGVYDINPSGVYKINPSGIESKISVFCDMMVVGGGWTAIQKRVSGSVRFNRTWTEYKTGFGSPNDSYWIGDDVIHQLTKGRNSSLYVSITLTNRTKLYELYNQFSVDDEANQYRLFLGGPATGTLGDAMLYTVNSAGDLSGMSFSTLDRDHDRTSDNCAVSKGGGGGWWYNACHLANLNGPWSPAEWDSPWSPTVMNSGEIRETLMMIKPH
ncbi:microfibril-associated glycoprotein 4-like [Saccostrea cucullata]|uniref:microfibril-associated glycoprotein 4-like n=1 Tax=Saccostrea cuccullata TaxID=36930 RepID=UPI002ED2EBF4